MAVLTPEDLLAGRDAVYDIEVPAETLRPAGDPGAPVGSVRVRPLTVGDVQLIAKAARDDEVLTSVLMIQRALVEPQLKQAEIATLHGGLVSFLVAEINRVSGLTTSDDELRALGESPLVQAFMILAREYHWTPQHLRELTVGEVLAYLDMAQQAREPV